MSTGKRLAKRSVLGMRICAPLEDGRFAPGVIDATKTEAGSKETIYCVLFDDKNHSTREYRSTELIGPNFQNITSVKLKHGQNVYITFNGREVMGTVVHHRPNIDQVILTIQPSSYNCHLTRPVEVKKKLEEIRLLESRKSVRLLDNDKDYCRLAEGQEPRRRISSFTIDVPSAQSGRKRRPTSVEDGDVMDECMAAMVLMSLSCSPNSPRYPEYGSYPHSWASSTSSSGVSSLDSPKSSIRTATPSPPVATKQKDSQDEGIEMDESVGFMEEHVSDKCKTQVLFQCTWPGCRQLYDTCESIEQHVRTVHLGRTKQQKTDLNDHEEEFYYTEIEVKKESCSSSPEMDGLEDPLSLTTCTPTISHLDMSKPPEENPELKTQQQYRVHDSSPTSDPISIPQGQTPVIQWYPHHSYVTSLPSSMVSPHKHPRLSTKSLSTSPKSSPQQRKVRLESRKCRKVYGMDNKDLWCTQCKWKKACIRFVD
ncbi:zinc finger protein 704-like isoform X2 [Tachypleus tridentatus]|uniref:zinc finger protein 704-like isoform X2 n=1 Tax=Tachypleus tridentatus TaxID=6853 RepID=UPI003FD68267